MTAEVLLTDYNQGIKGKKESMRFGLGQRRKMSPCIEVDKDWQKPCLGTFHLK
jgi:hypothetical protein